ncbi:hypothetical protein EV193_107167 [Herbihabitans rhizosphaerae]|uniref:Uncharacterized protein n=1 Tax=Herbihabitans rhizosphaerae TaxID=1872711 RepID=A0A4Q7KJW1_9PSEU|nr:hypothetical protein [Herbihabitans rhizosphaerae]RZS36486.1 hypothetical protein EV193_107167 [Herbihabitans rhizosphaerae]
MTGNVVVDAPPVGAGPPAVARLASLPGVGTASGVAERAQQARTTGEVLPVLAELEDALPWSGLRRGSTVSVRGSTSLLLALLAEATARGAWAAVVGVPDLGVVAASELGVEVARLALVPHPGAELAAVTAALLDGVDLVVLGGGLGRGLGGGTAGRLSRRARHRGTVLLAAGSWPGADVELRCETSDWRGVESGYGFLRERATVVHTTGRGAAARPVRTRLLLPGPSGRVERTPEEHVGVHAAWTAEEVG